MGCLIPHLLWSTLLVLTNGGEWLNFFYYWTLWGWFVSIIAQVMSLLAAWKPEYWHVTAFAWMEVAHSLNLGVTFAFWIILMPILWPQIPAGFPSSNQDYFVIAHMTILHATPIIMIWLNVHYTDIKLLSADWKLVVFHGCFYAFANLLGQTDQDSPIYPMTDWSNHTGIAVAFYMFGVPLMTGFYLGYCRWAN